MRGESRGGRQGLGSMHKVERPKKFIHFFFSICIMLLVVVVLYRLRRLR
jgi:hypothetical protein